VLEPSALNRLAALLCVAVQLRGEELARTALAGCLIDPKSQMVASVSIDPPTADVEMLLASLAPVCWRAETCRLSVCRSAEHSGRARLARNLAKVGGILDRVGRTTQAEEARSHAQRLTL